MCYTTGRRFSDNKLPWSAFILKSDTGSSSKTTKRQLLCREGSRCNTANFVDQNYPSMRVFVDTVDVHQGALLPDQRTSVTPQQGTCRLLMRLQFSAHSRNLLQEMKNKKRRNGDAALSCSTRRFREY